MIFLPARPAARRQGGFACRGVFMIARRRPRRFPLHLILCRVYKKIKKGDLSSPNKIFCWAFAILFPEKATAPAKSAAAPDTGKRAFLSLTASSEIAILNLSPLPLRADRGAGGIFWPAYISLFPGKRAANEKGRIAPPFCLFFRLFPFQTPCADLRCDQYAQKQQISR